MKAYEQYISQHPEVNAWTKNRPANTRREFAEILMRFKEASGLEPEEWRHLDKFKARDIAWSFVEPYVKEHSAVARKLRTALANWYRNLNGEVLPFDSGRGGKHHIHVTLKKAAKEHIPSKEESYRIIDAASRLRDKGIFQVLFQSGIRENAVSKLTYGMVADQLNQDIIVLKITDEIDEKLRGSNIPFYYTAINGEAVVTLRRYCEQRHKNSKPSTPLFTVGNSKKAIGSFSVYESFKRCVREAGFDPSTMWVHSLRKAFRKVVRQADVDDDDKEQLMGHVIKGSRSAYYDRHDVDLIKAAYEKCNFSREVPRSEVTKLRQQLEDEQQARTREKGNLEAEIKDLRESFTQLQRQLEALTKKS